MPILEWHEGADLALRQVLRFLAEWLEGHSIEVYSVLGSCLPGREDL
jgi:hypothetical protein